MLMFIKTLALSLGLVVASTLLLLPGQSTQAYEAIITRKQESTIATRPLPYTAEEVVTLINVARAEYGLVPLKISAELNVAATAKANDMVARQYFAHTSPDAMAFWNHIRNANYNFFNAGENLAIHYQSASDMVNAWLNSPKHRANLLSNRFTETGIGIVYGTYQGESGWFVSEMFARPAPKNMQLSVVY
jgi:uncharacterized protein YkwD